MAELRAFEPSWRDRLAGWMMGNERATPERRRFVEGLLGSSGLGNTGFGVVDATPIGGLLGAQEAAKEGDYRGAAMNAMFLGAGARTANKAALKAAEEMAAKGATRDAIWNETGWFKGVDGKWRFEIDDSGLSVDPSMKSGWGVAPETQPNKTLAKEMLAAGEKPKLIALETGYMVQPDGSLKKVEQPKRIVSHPQLGEAYNFSGLSINRENRLVGSGYEGNYDPSYMTAQGRTGKIDFSPTAKNPRSTVAHELQHAVQNEEGFARGGNVESFVDAMPDPQAINDAQVLAAFERRGISPDRAPSEFLNLLGRDPHPAGLTLFYETDLKKLAQMPPTPFDAYRRLAGEVEARNVQTRLDMTPIERRATPPWKTQEYPDELQIIRGLLRD